MRRFTAESLRQQVEALMLAWGMKAERAARTARIVVDADVRGIDSHGISMVMAYDAMVRSGELRMAARPQVVHDSGGIVVLDAAGGLGHPVADEAVRLAMARARELGVAAVTVRNSHHFGAAGHFARTAAEQGFVAMVTSSARTLALTPTGGTEPRLGTNPVAFAAPAGRNAPFVLDMATTVVAVNKVKTYALRGTPLPAAWVTDRDGTPLHDSTEAFAALSGDGSGGLAPLGGPSPVTGGHKGYGLAMMVQILSAALSGAGLPGSGPPTDIGHFFLVIDPAVAGSGPSTAAYVDDLVDLMRATPPIDPTTPVLVAGDPEEAMLRNRTRNGVPMPDTLVDAVLAVCRRWDVAPVLAQAANSGGT